KIEAGKLAIELSPISLRELVSEVEALLSLQAADKGIEFHFTVDAATPDGLVTDGLRLKQVLLNVIGNAIKFTEKGFVRVGVRATSDKGKSRLVFSVEDSGIGLTGDLARNMFEPFTQGDGSTTRRFGGTGLGLSLARRIARILGGDVV